MLHFTCVCACNFVKPGSHVRPKRKRKKNANARKHTSELPQRKCKRKLKLGARNGQFSVPFVCVSVASVNQALNLNKLNMDDLCGLLKRFQVIPYLLELNLSPNPLCHADRATRRQLAEALLSLDFKLSNRPF